MPWAKYGGKDVAREREKERERKERERELRFNVELFCMLLQGV